MQGLEELGALAKKLEPARQSTAMLYAGVIRKEPEKPEFSGS